MAQAARNGRNGAGSGFRRVWLTILTGSFVGHELCTSNPYFNNVTLWTLAGSGGDYSMTQWTCTQTCRGSSSGRRTSAAVLGRGEKTALILLCSWLLVMSCGLSPGPSETDQNAALRQALRADPAFRMIPAPVRASMVELLPNSGGFTGPQYGAMGWGGSELWDGSDPTPRVLEWGRRLESAGWTPAGAGPEARWARAGICAKDRTGAEINEGMWRKTIKGRCAWFIYGLNVKKVEYGIYTTAVGDAYGCPSPPDHPLGCGGSA